MKFRIIVLSFLMVVVGFVVLCGCDPIFKEPPEQVISKEPIVQPFCPEYIFTVCQIPRQIGDLQIKRVIVERKTKDGSFLFSAMIISPDRKLVVGEEVKLLEISYPYNGIGNRQSFLLIK